MLYFFTKGSIYSFSGGYNGSQYTSSVLKYDTNKIHDGPIEETYNILHSKLRQIPICQTLQSANNWQYRP